jgi:hypothetical protein
MTKEEKQIVLKVFRLMLENEGCFVSGICRWITILWRQRLINVVEAVEVTRYLSDNLPPTIDNAYCWEVGKITSRIEWIKEQIVKLENELK